MLEWYLVWRLIKRIRGRREQRRLVLIRLVSQDVGKLCGGVLLNTHRVSSTEEVRLNSLDFGVSLLLGTAIFEEEVEFCVSRVLRTLSILGQNRGNGVAGVFSAFLECPYGRHRSRWPQSLSGDSVAHLVDSGGGLSRSLELTRCEWAFGRWPILSSGGARCRKGCSPLLMLPKLVANFPLHFVQLVKLILGYLDLPLDDVSVSVNFPLESLVLLLLGSVLGEESFLTLPVFHDPSYPIISALPVDRDFRVLLRPIWIGPR